MKTPRSYLFVPGDRPERFAKAAASGAHQIIIDLEDAVAIEKKDFARGEILRWFGEGNTGAVRINAEDSTWFEADLEMLTQIPDVLVVVPKAEPSGLARVAEKLPGRPLIALIETVDGYLEIEKVAGAKGVTRLAFGHLDFGVDARIPGEGIEIDPVRFQLAIWSRKLGLDRPVEGVTVTLDDPDGLAAGIARARNFGFGAKLCIHPKQVALVNEGFAPAAGELDWARRVVAACEANPGAAVNVDGKMVDKPVLDRALAILEDGE